MPPRFSPRTLAQWPWVVVRLDCVLCRRRGCYRLARLAARYGPEQSIDGLLRDLAHDCPWYNERPRRYEPRCGARFTDLEHAFPPADHPNEPIYRQRGPDRESLPKPKGSGRGSAPTGQGPRLSGWAHTALELSCPGCGLCKVFDVAELRASLPGGDMAITYLRDHLTGGCVSRKAHRVTDRCEVRIIMPRARSGPPGE